MKLRQIGSNMTELEFDGVDVLFSYETPVAAYVVGRGFLRTDQHYSATTTRHINRWLNGVAAEEVPQSVIDSLVG